MKRSLIVAFSLSVLASSAFAAAVFDRPPAATFTEDGYNSTRSANFAEDGYDSTRSASFAEDGYDRTNGHRLS